MFLCDCYKDGFEFINHASSPTNFAMGQFHMIGKWLGGLRIKANTKRAHDGGGDGKRTTPLLK